MTEKQIQELFTFDYWCNPNNPPTISYTFDEQGTDEELAPMLQSVHLTRTITNSDDGIMGIQLDTAKDTLTIHKIGEVTEYEVEENLDIENVNLLTDILSYYEERFSDIY